MATAEPVTVRKALLSDAPQIVEIHADDGSYWYNSLWYAISLNHSLLRGFLNEVAELWGKVVGHTEWVLSDEPQPAGRHLFLETLWVHKPYRGQGVGNKLIASGIASARQRGCSSLRTSPNSDATGFYAKCGFERERSTVTYWIPVEEADFPAGWRYCSSVPLSVVRQLPMRFGWYGSSSRTRWELVHRPTLIAGESRGRHLTARREDGSAFVQLAYTKDEMDSYAYGWGDTRASTEELVRAALAIASRRRKSRVQVFAEKADEMLLKRFPGSSFVVADEVWIHAPLR